MVTGHGLAIVMNGLLVVGSTLALVIAGYHIVGIMSATAGTWKKVTGKVTNADSQHR
jgi:hypothetical protein